MAPPFPRPGYIPEPVWSLYLELLTSDPDKPGAPLLSRPRYDAPIRRLFGVHRESPRDRNGQPEIARTWRRLAKTPRAAQDWRSFFDLLWSLPDSFDADARTGVADCRDLAPEIAGLADALANTLERYLDLAERHAITCPDALLLPEALIGEAATRYPLDDPDAYTLHCEPWFVTGCAPGVDVDHLPRTLDLVRALADVCNDLSPCCEAPAGAHANTRESSNFAAPVRCFDERLKLLHRVTVSTFEPSDLDTAHILTAVLGRSVSRQAVADARNKKGKD